VDGTLHDIFFEGGNGVGIGSKTIISSTRLINGAIRFNALNLTGVLDSTGPFTLYLSTGGKKVSGVTFNGKIVQYLSDGAALQVDLPGPGELEVISSDNATANTPQTIIMPLIKSIDEQGITTIRQPNMTEYSTSSIPYRIPLSEPKLYATLIPVIVALLAASVVIIVYIKWRLR
jgi:hypothetical protein